MYRSLSLTFAAILLVGCQPDWPALVDTEPASQFDTPSMERIVTASEEQPEIPEQDVRCDWLKGKVVHIVDGDTLDLLIDEEDSPKKIRIRLQGIDCPEGGQPWGKRAKQALSELVFGETVEVLSIGEDRHERLLGRIYVGEDDQRLDVNLALVAQGLAWHFKRYSDDEDLSEAELAARRERRGGTGGQVLRKPGEIKLRCAVALRRPRAFFKSRGRPQRHWP